MARGVPGDVDPLVGMSRDPKPPEVSEVGRGEMTDEALRVRSFQGGEILGGDGGGGELKCCYKSWKKEEIGGTTVCLARFRRLSTVLEWEVLGWEAMSARGAAGGVVVFWGQESLGASRPWRELFWEELGAIRGLWSDPWCIGGDFNVVRFPSERSREGRITGSMRRFSEVGSFSNFGGVGESLQWGFQCSLPRPVSDHFPILIDGGGLKEWNSEVFGRIEVNKRLALDKVSHWDIQEQLRVLNDWELEARKEAKEDFKKWVLMEEISWRQKSRQTWLKEGDKNTGFFHKMANSNRRKNCLKKIKVNGNWLSEEQEIQRGVVRAFQSLLSDPGGWRPSVNNLEFDSIGVEEAARLELMFTVEEVFLALSELNGDKAPGPDGLNTTFLVLIPKKGGAEDLTDFRPISLVGSLYKLLAKVLANRLKKVVGKVVSTTQNAFVEGRQILDAALIANEVIDSLMKRKESGVLCKLDLEKAYDRINWDFLLTRGLRQGDPLSPYLFVLGMEALTSLINRAVRGGYLSGCSIRGREGAEIRVSHLLFADDTLVFCEDSQEQLAFLSWLLLWFEATSGLRINLNKSEILPVGRVENAELLAAELGCKVGSLPSTYLGLPLGASHKSVMVWDGMEERMRKRLALWKRQFISKGGRITLIRSTLASIPTYLMSLMRGALEKKPHLIKWGIVCSHKKKGGLGIRDLTILNRALLCKWSWRFAVERDSYWKLIIGTKFGVGSGGWCTCGGREGYGVGLWKEISKEGLLLLNNVSFSVGDGKRVRFWKDKWCGNTPLCEAYPSLFDLAVSKARRLRTVGTLGEDGVEETKDGKFSVKSCFNSLDHSSAVPFPGELFGVRLFLPRWAFLLGKPLGGRDTLLGWLAPLKDKKRSKVWRAAPLCLFWTFGRKEIG
ncbi:LINE-1 retrotransposable element ORF2 protein [Vitis vinifera]|uniref:LINE-1 retrotransposable element ORF2 protein n=1 Tax=Vitis vinifera TaxID=29760 RepID=A0A438F714_VITVI|nr:LINE-1 retrotransposable element ORF2 protein [Vitis vinifera]